MVTETSEMETEENKTDADVDEPKNDVTTPIANDFGADHQSSDASSIQRNGSLPVDASSTDFVVSISKSSDFPGDKFFEKLSRVLKPGGEIVIHQTSADAKETTKSSLVRKVLVAGFSDIEVVQVAKLQSFGSKAKKRTWKLGSSFSLKKTVKSLPKVLIDDEMDLIDEDSLLSEEDFKKPPQLSDQQC